MTLTEQQISLISKNPLNDTLDRSQVKLSGCDETDQALRDEIASLLSALVGSTAAFNPCSRWKRRFGGEALFCTTTRSRRWVKLDHFRPLIRSVVNNAPDVVIWDAVFGLIDTLSALTSPPSSIVPTYKGTPVKTSSSRLADGETRDIVERELFFEIKDCTFRNVGGFCDKFFDSKSWRKEQKVMLKRMMVAHDGKKWTDFPSTSDEKAVWTWLRALEERFLTDAPHKLYTTRTANQFKERKGQMDLFFQKPARKANSTFTYKDVLVVGEQKKSEDKFKATLLQLTRLEGLIVRQRAIVCRGTTCYRTRNGHVAKFSWASDKRKPEVDHLKHAEGTGVSKPHGFRDEDVHFRDLPSAVGSTGTASHKRKSSSDNTIYSCLVVSPAGRVISDFKSIRELLESLRDAIRAHQSLYVTGNILHRDISSNNVIIADAKKPGTSKECSSTLTWPKEAA
ncbi:uncharacterized protein HRG_11906 [Hirsutella rhossiliensis]|uniref:non-specific serine/threonine protein kinase n=1 Tax=Hirsutella rhossiliensis TaxID=111463 RepID=A0A9P8MKX5_9HYPO|nr:uncharacterized protein HRG_11906 [Hirsutella rhossiliensis]KAH0957038.1 hypothetical protein HRG_11906 [Hirsutella rhossiliensis]